MAGIKQPIQDILLQLTEIQVVNQDHQTVGLFSRIWNNQLQETINGKMYDWPRPAAFVEIINNATYDVIGLGYRSADLGIKIHLIHEFYNNDGSYEQDLGIFDLRDLILRKLSQYCPTACGPLNCIREEQQYDHSNLYHYVLEFVCNFIDSKGTPFDLEAGRYIETANPDLDLLVENGGVPEPVVDPNPEFIIPTKPI